MKIMELFKLSQEQRNTKRQYEQLLSKISTPDNRYFRPTTHFVNKTIEKSIRPSQVVAMIKKAFKVHKHKIEQMEPKNRVVIMRSSGLGVVLGRASTDTGAGWILITVDPTLNNTVNPSPELRV